MRASIIVAALAAAFTTSASPMPVVKLPRTLSWANNTIAAKRSWNETAGFNGIVKRDNMTSNYTSNYTSSNTSLYTSRAVKSPRKRYLPVVIVDTKEDA